MRFVILGGAGAVGAAVVRDLLACADVQQVVIADIDLQRAEKLAAACAAPRAVARALDVRNAGEVRAILRSADVAVNCAFYRYNLA
ncbi:MAG: saccharopine dehydrogenase NADP-binding domain-containing protein [Candidatus Rokubacteria bacterium]|nr:saccharopine dehydrogenase NADP-binding domain-containing protein [Candidatus Rokubacteria bacterium]